MGFLKIESGIIQPYRSEKGANQPIKKIQQTGKKHEVHDFEEELVSAMDRTRSSVVHHSYQKANQTHRERRAALYAHQIMTTPVVSLTSDTGLDEAWDLVKTHRFRHVPVTTGDLLTGIISDRDLLREALRTKEKKPHGKEEPEQIPLANLIKTEVIAAYSESEIRQIAKILFEERIGSMPIVSKTRQLIGIITRSDILRTLVNQAPLELWV